MGQQQLLLIVLSVIIVGIAVVVGIQMFGASAASSNQEAVINDLTNLAAKAQQYFVKPVSMGGGGNSFVGIAMQHMAPVASSVTEWSTENGAYSISTAGTATAVQLTGTGTFQDSDSNVAQVIMSVSPNAISIVSINRVAASSGE